ncbi:hypothetical protein BDZ89DRAFT_1141902 [Hymenopellis radicata]|nr:hypothetical protein BDZ89DRAFT_1141902 [Hymenopellis radicata]
MSALLTRIAKIIQAMLALKSHCDRHHLRLLCADDQIDRGPTIDADVLTTMRIPSMASARACPRRSEMLSHLEHSRLQRSHGEIAEIPLQSPTPRKALPRPGIRGAALLEPWYTDDNAGGHVVRFGRYEGMLIRQFPLALIGAATLRWDGLTLPLSSCTCTALKRTLGMSSLLRRTKLCRA